jgi:hypothetical protein
VAAQRRRSDVACPRRYRAEILGGLADAGEEVLHVFLEADADVLKERLSASAFTGTYWSQTDYAPRAKGCGMESGQ